jgi:hypothetical protein
MAFCCLGSLAFPFGLDERHAEHTILGRMYRKKSLKRRCANRISVLGKAVLSVELLDHI